MVLSVRELRETSPECGFLEGAANAHSWAANAISATRTATLSDHLDRWYGSLHRPPWNLP
jgi:hypothetical protein